MALNLDRFERLASRFPIRDRDTGRTVPFLFTPSQQRIQREVKLHRRPDMPLQVILYKSRRTGGSTWAVALLVAHCLSKPGAKAAIVAQLDATAKELYDERAIPFAEALTARGLNIKITKTEIRFYFPNGRYSRLYKRTAKTVIGGRGLTASAVLLSEAAYYPGEESFVSILNALSKDPDNIIIIETTPNGIEGPGEVFYNYWNAAVEGVNGFIPVFMPPYEDPGFSLPASMAEDAPRDEYERWLMKQFHVSREFIAWYRWTMEMKCAGSHDKMKQENPMCLTAGMRVSTELGILPVSEAHNVKLTESGPIVRWHIQPPSPIYKLTTRQGRILRGTHDHPIMTSQGWKDLCDLQPNDEVILRPPRFAENICRVNWRSIPGATVSVEVNEDWGLLLGYFLGDGCWYKTEFNIACDARDKDVVCEVAHLTDKLIGPTRVTNVARVKGRKGCDYVSSRGRDEDGRSAARYVLLHLGVVERSTKVKDYITRRLEVPDCIWKSPKGVVAKFLSGLFEADGSYNQTIGQVVFHSKSNSLIRSVQLLLLGFGIDSSIGQANKRGGSGKPYIGYCLRCTRYGSEIFLKEIGFRSDRKKSWRCGRKLSEGKLHLNVDYVASVVPDGIEPTYDFTIEGEAAFSAEGILTHNTPEEGFIASGTPAFDSEELGIAQHSVCKPVARGTMRDYSGEFKFDQSTTGSLYIWEYPQPGAQYYMGVDAAKGVGTGDFCSISIFNGDTGAKAARLSDRIKPETAAFFVNGLGRWYNNAMVNIEFTGGWGYIIAKELRDTYCYPTQYLWRSRDESIEAKPRKSMGWETTDRTRRMLIDLYRTALRRGAIQVKDIVVVQQMSRCSMEIGWRWTVIKGHDDTLMSDFLAWVCVEQYHVPRLGKPNANVLETQEKKADEGAAWVADPFSNETGMLTVMGNDHLKKLEVYNKRAKQGNRLAGV